MRVILIGTHDDQTPARSIDPAHVIDVVTQLEIDTKDFLVIAQPVAPFRRCRVALNCEIENPMKSTAMLCP